MNSCIFLLGFMLIRFVAAKPSGPSPPRCGSQASCNFGQKRVCAMKNGKTSFVNCIQPSKACKQALKSFCTAPEVPICNELSIECICSCGQGTGIFGNRRKSG
ncbi:uncharacterized protein LOC142587103 [Dermacentor variabilis]|uniref:uncharacterized protein LOC142587103 n=1 Tax=Dermacentor variabilis TaxID=34621 RepID=UPI003F5B9729